MGPGVDGVAETVARKETSLSNGVGRLPGLVS